MEKKQHEYAKKNKKKNEGAKCLNVPHQTHHTGIIFHLCCLIFYFFHKFIPSVQKTRFIYNYDSRFFVVVVILEPWASDGILCEIFMKMQKYSQLWVCSDDIPFDGNELNREIVSWSGTYRFLVESHMDSFFLWFVSEENFTGFLVRNYSRAEAMLNYADSLW